jgi:cysteine desulfurase/selenocysteine lyase
VDWVSEIGLDEIAAAEHLLLEHATAALTAIPGVRIIGTAAEKSAIISFVVGEIHAHDIGSIADREGVALRTGHHCTQPVMERFGVPATARAAFALYNDQADIDALVRAVEAARELFG